MIRIAALLVSLIACTAPITEKDVPGVYHREEPAIIDTLIRVTFANFGQPPGFWSAIIERGPKGPHLLIDDDLNLYDVR